MDLKEKIITYFDDPKESFWFTRKIFLIGLGFIYFCVFFPLLFQYPGLLGTHGLLPVSLFLERMGEYLPAPQWWNYPTLFWINQSNAFALSLASLGLILSIAVMLGFANSIILFLLWLLQLSFTHIGQDFWGFGWESNLLEMGFLSIFFVPRWKGTLPPSKIIIWLYRWVLFRLMVGAGLIKLRGDACWTDLTCLAYHYETQPIPNPLSPLFHFAPMWFHKLSALLNHFVELICPFLLLFSYRFRTFAGICFLIFQMCIMVTGNYAWINHLTLLMIIPCFDDRALKMFFPKKNIPETRGFNLSQKIVVFSLLGLVLFKSWKPLINLIGPRQVMNTSYDQFQLVNSYGVFGSVGRERYEVIISGSNDGINWKEYEIPCKPGDVNKMPCIISPYHYRITWQIWFAAMGDYSQSPWLIHLIYKLLKGDKDALGLLSNDPFGGVPPKYIKVDKYRYRFSKGYENGWYQREKVDVYLPVLSLESKTLLQYVKQQGWPL
jgi:hypothetical protein